MYPLINPIFSQIAQGSLTIKEENDVHAFGSKGTGPEGGIIVRDPKLYRNILQYGSLGLGESYMDGLWDAERGDLVSVIGVLLMNHLSRAVPRSLRLAAKVLRLTPTGATDHDRSKRNIQSHYDIGNDFYALFLDKNMGYTCGYQLHPDDTTEQMQDQKHDRVCRKLGLKPGERIVDLGCGFGGMLRYAAKHYGIEGIGCTLSEGQAAWANQAIEADGLHDRIRVELKDYRDIEGTFDKVVSIGMAEHAWENGYEKLMEKIASLLPQGGIGLVHTIGSLEDPSDQTDPWISKYIFPGGRIPRLSELTGATNAANLTIAHIENLKPHYAETLRLWREKFHGNRERILALSPRYNERFLRMWDYYLQSCEAAFRYSSLELYQMLFCKGERWTLPMQLDFGESEKR